jgi:hypothetical protein
MVFANRQLGSLRTSLRFGTPHHEDETTCAFRCGSCAQIMAAATLAGVLAAVTVIAFVVTIR